jgi:hypothetical protein
LRPELHALEIERIERARALVFGEEAVREDGAEQLLVASPELDPAISG